MSDILVIEDEPAIAELIAINLRHAGHGVRVATDADQAQTAIDSVLPDLAIIDWMLPGNSGLALTKRWRAQPRTRELPIIMLTARVEESDKITALDAGADDYLTKPFSPQELMARIRAVLRRRAPDALDTEVVVGSLKINPATRRLAARGRDVRLGATEFRLLHFMMSYPERVHTRQQLLDRVWGDHVFIEERTVDVHVKRLRETLSTADCAQVIETVRGVGYRLVAEPSSSRAPETPAGEPADMPRTPSVRRS